MLAIDGLRENGLSRDDAIELWVGGCADIPPDGNFEGDVDACESCLPVLVEAVYPASATTALLP